MSHLSSDSRSFKSQEDKYSKDLDDISTSNSQCSMSTAGPGGVKQGDGDSFMSVVLFLALQRCNGFIVVQRAVQPAQAELHFLEKISKNVLMGSVDRIASCVMHSNHFYSNRVKMFVKSPINERFLDSLPHSQSFADLSGFWGTKELPDKFGENTTQI